MKKKTGKKHTHNIQQHTLESSKQAKRLSSSGGSDSSTMTMVNDSSRQYSNNTHTQTYYIRQEVTQPLHVIATDIHFDVEKEGKETTTKATTPLMYKL